MKILRARRFSRLAIFLPVFSLALSFLFLVSQPGGADSAYKVPTANPTFVSGSRVSGNFVNVQAIDGTYMRVRESLAGGVRYLDTRWQNWQSFTEASRSKLINIVIELEGYQTVASDSWYVQFYNYNTGAWDTSWYSLGSLPTVPVGNLQVAVNDAARSRTFVSAAGAFQLRFVDNNTAMGGTDGTRTNLYIDLLRARFIYDITSPASTITAPLDLEQTNATSYTIRGISSDPAPDASGVTLVEVSVNGGSSWNTVTPVAPGDYSSWSYIWNPIPGEGAYNIRSRATDGCGNVETPGAGVRLIADWTRPQVSGVTPLNGAINVNVSTNLTAGFLEDNNMKASTINSSTFTLVDEDGTPISGTISYDSVGKVATFDPTSDLFHGYNYTATLTTGITDLVGNSLAANYVWTFRTADILSMTLTGTYNRDGTPGGGSVNFGPMSPEAAPFVVGGGTPPYAVRLNVKSSTNWNLLLRATADLTDNVQVPPVTIPLSQLQWGLTGIDIWTPFTLLDAAVYLSARSRTPQPAGSNIDFDLRMDLYWDDAPGSYSTGAVFTVIQQP